MDTTLAGKAYDDAQTEALRIRDQYIASILLNVSVIRREGGNLDIVADCLDDIARDARKALAVNNDLSLNRLGDYDATVVACARGCGRRHQRNQACLCRG